MTHRIATAVWGSAALALATLSMCSPPAVPGDAADAAGRDAGSPADMGADGASADVGTHDAAGDGWLAVGGDWPASCEVDLATSQLLATTAFTTTACADRANCREVAPPFSPFVVADYEPSDQGSTVTLGMRAPTGPRYESWVFDRDGHARFGLRSMVASAGGTGCNVAIGGTQGDAVVLQMEVGAGSAISTFAARASFSDPTTLEDLGDIGAPGGDADFPALTIVGDEDVYFQMSGGSLWDVSTPGAQAQIWNASADGRVGDASGRFGDTLFFTVFDASGAPYAIDVRVRRRGEAVESMFADGVLRGSMAGDGTDLAWIEVHDWSSGAESGVMELYASPYADRASALAPRHVTTMHGDALLPMSVGGGYVAIVEAADAIAVYRLGDGARAELAPASGTTWDSPHGIHDGELLVSSADRTVFPVDTAHLMFVELASLDYVAP